MTSISDLGTDTPEDEDVYSLDAQIGYVLRLANQRHASIFHALIPRDLTPTQFAALARLAEITECSQNELGRRTAMDVATIKGVTERLRDKGLVEVRPDENDRRRLLVSLSDEGSRLITELHAAGRAITKATLAPLSNTESKTLLRLLSKLT